MSAAKDSTKTYGWCNSMRSYKCQFMKKRQGCKFAHVDKYCEMSAEERKKMNMPSIMDKHAKLLRTQYLSDLKAVAAILPSGTAGTYDYVRTIFEVLGWDLSNSTHHRCNENLGKSIIKLIAQTLHYDLQGAPDIMFQTIEKIEAFIGRSLAGAPKAPVAKLVTPPSPPAADTQPADETVAETQSPHIEQPAQHGSPQNGRLESSTGVDSVAMSSLSLSTSGLPRLDLDSIERHPLDDESTAYTSDASADCQATVVRADNFSHGSSSSAVSVTPRGCPDPESPDAVSGDELQIWITATQ